jgi:hypothetical protein
MANSVKIGRGLVVGKGLGALRWGGPVVFDGEAIYACPNVTRQLLVQGQDETPSTAGVFFGAMGLAAGYGLSRGQKALSAALGVVAGLVVRAVVGALQKSAHSEDGWKSWVVDYTDLPREVTGSSDWPLRKLDGSVIVVSRGDVNRIERKGGKLLVQTGGGTFRFALKLFGRSGAVQSVRQLGWQIC